MDRDQVSRGGSQVGFISFMGAPLFETLSSVFPELEVVSNNLQSNLEKWKEVAAEEKKEKEEEGTEEDKDNDGDAQ